MGRERREFHPLGTGAGARQLLAVPPRSVPAPTARAAEAHPRPRLRRGQADPPPGRHGLRRTRRRPLAGDDRSSTRGRSIDRARRRRRGRAALCGCVVRAGRRLPDAHGHGRHARGGAGGRSRPCPRRPVVPRGRPPDQRSGEVRGRVVRDRGVVSRQLHLPRIGVAQRSGHDVRRPPRAAGDVRRRAGGRRVRRRAPARAVVPEHAVHSERDRRWQRVPLFLHIRAARR